MIKRKLGRLFLGLGFALLIALFSWEVFSQELSIVEVKRNIALSDEAPIYRDYYINGGEESGLKKNMVVQVLRRLPVKDNAGVQSFGEIQVPVGQIKVIFVQGKVAVARDYKLASRVDLPVLEQNAIMSGDRLDLKSSFIDSKKGSGR